MILRLIVFISMMMNVAQVSAQSADELVKRDKRQCSSVASEKHAWVLHPILWRSAYNSCLRERLQKLSPTYLANSLQAIKLEDECPMFLMDKQPTEISTMGFEIVNHLTAKEMERSPASDNIEHHLRLYYQRTIESRDRVKELRHRK